MHQSEPEIWLSENYLLSSSALPSKNNNRYSLKCLINKCVYYNDVV